MAIESIEPVGSGVRPQQESLDAGASGGEGVDEFAPTLDSASAQVQTGAADVPAGTQPVSDASTIPAPTSVETAQPAAGAGSADPVGASAASEILNRIGDGHARLDALIGEIRSGQTYSVQELLGLQAEMYKLTVELNATTTLAAEGVRATNRLLQQQI